MVIEVIAFLSVYRALRSFFGIDTEQKAVMNIKPVKRGWSLSERLVNLIVIRLRIVPLSLDTILNVLFGIAFTEGPQPARFLFSVVRNDSHILAPSF